MKITKEQIAEWKKKHGEIFEISFAQADPKRPIVRLRGERPCEDERSNAERSMDSRR